MDIEFLPRICGYQSSFLPTDIIVISSLCEMQASPPLIFLLTYLLVII